MAEFFGVIGLMTCIYVLYELLSSVSRGSDNGSVGILDIIVSFLALVCMVSSLPIGWLVRWHDSVMEKIHRELFLEDRKQYDEINKNKQMRMEEEIRILTDRLKEANCRPSFHEVILDAHNLGYKEGYRDGQQDHAAGITLLDDLGD